MEHITLLQLIVNRTKEIEKIYKRIIGMVQKSIKLALHFYLSMKLFLIEFRAHTGETQRLGKFGAKISESVKWKCQANLNHAELSILE